jgi:acylphosphatase
MKPLLAGVLVALLSPGPAPAFAADRAPTAVKGRVSGKVQKVGFRALILKQAIRFNLAGTAKNNTDGTVAFLLQGDAAHIKAALKVIAKGTARSSDVKVQTAGATADPKLRTFTVLGWTSSSRHITNPYDLVFTVRKKDLPLSEKEAEKEYHEILKKTLNKEDREKLKK